MVLPRAFFYGEEKNWGQAARSLWVFLFKASLALVYADMFLQRVVSGLSSQDSAWMSSCFALSSAFSYLSYEYIRDSDSEETRCILNKAGFSSFRLHVINFMRICLGNHIHLEIQPIILKTNILPNSELTWKSRMYVELTYDCVLYFFSLIHSSYAMPIWAFLTQHVCHKQNKQIQSIPPRTFFSK